MNLVAFGLILICCHAWAIGTDNYPADKFQEECTENCTEFEIFLKNKCKDILQTGDDTLNIPQLDPFEKVESHISIDNIKDEIKLDVSLIDIFVIGLSNYIVNKGDFLLIPPNVTLDLTISHLIANFDYKQLTGKIGRYEIWGDHGNIEISAKNIHFTAAISYTLDNKWKHMEVTGVNTTLSLEKLKCNATGLFNDATSSYIMSYLISKMMPTLIEKHQEEITQKLNEIIEEKLKGFTSKWLFEEILEIVGVDPFSYIGTVLINQLHSGNYYM